MMALKEVDLGYLFCFFLFIINSLVPSTNKRIQVIGYAVLFTVRLYPFKLKLHFPALHSSLQRSLSLGGLLFLQSGSI